VSGGGGGRLGGGRLGGGGNVMNDIVDVKERLPTWLLSSFLVVVSPCFRLAMLLPLPRVS
jgi:hypothetical protein